MSASQSPGAANDQATDQDNDQARNPENPENDYTKLYKTWISYRLNCKF